MRRNNYKQVSVITASSSSEFQDKLNAELKRVALEEGAYSIEYNTQFGLCAYITYEHVEEVAETIADEFELKGSKCTCKDCPLFRPPMDGRVRFGKCSFYNAACNPNDKACDKFYKDGLYE